jgi:Tol biopolymer transport system component
MNSGTHYQNHPRRLLLYVVVIVFSALLMIPLAREMAQAAPGDVVLVSSDTDGTQGNDASLYPTAISANGRYVAFDSNATNLVTPATTGQQVFRKDTVTGETILCSADAAGAQGNDISYSSSISSDGRYVAFFSVANNLIPGVSGIQVYRKDLLTGSILLVSCNAAGTQGDDFSASPKMSSDGRYVAFFSIATNLIIGVTGTQVFRKDLLTGDIMLCSNAAGALGNGASRAPSITSDGRYVTFDSLSTNLVTPATTGQQVFRKDTVTGAVKLCSSNAAGSQGNGSSNYHTIAPDGRYVTFDSLSTNLVTPATTGQQVFRKDLETGEVRLVSADATGTQGNSSSSSPDITPDGRYVAFSSFSTNLIAGVSGQHVYRKDLVTGGIILCSADPAGTPADNPNDYPAISSDGRFTAFHSNATNLIPGVIGQQIFRKELVVPTFYFAEGYTGSGFQEYLCLGQLLDVPLDVTVTYLFKDGSLPKVETYQVPPISRFTVNVNAVVGNDKEVSMKCEADWPFIAERPMYFDYQGAWTGGHDVVGAKAPADRWYFAEGYTGTGFDEWICVLNPGGTAADLTFRFQTQEEGEKVVTGFSVPAGSRQSFKANDLLGGGSYQTSLALESTQPVVAERPMYFNYQGTGGWNWTGGHCVVGVPELATDYYFAEGTTRAGFEEWLTLQNPGASDISVHATYQLGSGAPIEMDYPVPAAKRFTIYVPLQVGADRDVSVRLTSASPFLAERPMYFSYQGMGAWGWTGGHCVIGATGDSGNWSFAEGYTGAGFEEWLCIQNPGATDAAVTVTYYPEGGAAPITSVHGVAANSRYTIPVNVDAGSDLSISAKVSSTVPVICERPMYFNFQAKWNGGHDVVGYTP